MSSAEMAGITQLFHQLVLESTVIIGASEGLVIVSLSSGRSSLTLYVLDSSLASVECQESSKLLVASPPACSLRTSFPRGCSSQNMIKSCTLCAGLVRCSCCGCASGALPGDICLTVLGTRQALALPTEAGWAELIAAILKPTFRGMNAMYQLLSSITF